MTNTQVTPHDSESSACTSCNICGENSFIVVGNYVGKGFYNNNFNPLCREHALVLFCELKGILNET